MPKPKKIKVLDFNGTNFTIATTVQPNGGGRSRTLHGQPRIRINKDSVTVGCMFISNEAIAYLHGLTYAGTGALPDGLFQEGNYKSVEE